jgi:hypothetical protein
MAGEASLPGRLHVCPGESWAEAATSRPLTTDHIAIVRRIGEVRRAQAGDVLFREGWLGGEHRRLRLGKQAPQWLAA